MKPFQRTVIKARSKANFIKQQTLFTITALFTSLSVQATPTFSEDVQQYITHQQNKIAFVNATLIDGTGVEPKTAQTVVIEDGVISYVGSHNKSAVVDAEVVNLAGKTLIPGLILMHEHMFYPEITPNGLYHMTQQDYSFPRMYLAGGATSIRTAGGIEPESDLRLKKYINAGKMVGPKMDVTASYVEDISREPGFFTTQGSYLNGKEQVIDMMRFWHKRGTTSFKTYETVTRDEMKAAIAFAHDAGQKITGHLCSVTFAEAAKMGIDNLEHGIYAASDFIKNKTPDECPSGMSNAMLNLDIKGKEVGQLIDTLVKHDVAITFTLAVYEPSIYGRPPVYKEVLDSLAEPFRQSYQASWARVQKSKNKKQLVLFKKEMDFEKRFVEKGGRLMVGTDPTGSGGTIAGYSGMRALELLAEAVFNTEQVIKIATLNAAQYMNSDADIGSIALGKKADMVVINGLLHKDMSNIRNIQWVFKEGIGYDSKRLFESVKGVVGLY